MANKKVGALSRRDIVAIASQGYDPNEPDFLLNFIDKGGNLLSAKRRAEVGDTLAEFIAVELFDGLEYDRPSLQQLVAAMQSIHTAKRQIEGAYEALEQAFIERSHIPPRLAKKVSNG